MIKSGKLTGMRAYCCGAMDRAKDGGIGWRKKITPFLNELGIIVLDPCNKPIDIGIENIESREYRQSLKNNEDWETLSNDMRLVRVVDLCMTDSSDIIIVNLDIDTYACGT